VPWAIPSQHPAYRDAPTGCPGCAGHPPDAGDGAGQCSRCGAILVCLDPPPGEVTVLRLVPVDTDLRPLPQRERRTIEVRWGDRRQADGTLARVYRLVDRQNDRYIERVVRADGATLHQDEPLSRHRGHGAARG
jgi:hypothetical protein